jgi:hypothetical protein
LAPINKNNGKYNFTYEFGYILLHQLKPIQDGQPSTLTRNISVAYTCNYHPYYLGINLKLMALWKSARNNHLAWFICIAIINTIGILPIVYILMHKKKSTTEKTTV